MNREGRPRLAILLGPTASGKTELGTAWAERLGGEIISADSVQVYRYMDIGTAKPSLDIRRRLRHHLIDMVDPDEPFSASQFEHHARLSISDICKRGRVPLVIGGTGLYLRALLHGLFEGPQGDPAFRERLAGKAKKHGVLQLHQDLQKIDLEAAERIHPNDLIRVIRALEVFHLTGVPISQHQQRHRFARRRYHALCLGLTVDRSPLYRRINARVNKMIAQGLIQEVEDLLARGYNLELPALQAIGYRHIGGYLQGFYSLGEALKAMKRDTRHYARRQMTWFKGMPEIRWFMPEEAPRILEEVQRFFEETL